MANHFTLIIHVYGLLTFTFQPFSAQLFIQGITIDSLQKSKSQFRMNLVSGMNDPLCQLLV